MRAGRLGITYFSIPEYAGELSHLRTLGYAPNVESSSYIWDLSWSNDGHYLGIAGESSPYINLWEVNETHALLKQQNPSTLPIGNGNGAAFDNRGNCLAIAHVGSPFITVYNRSSSKLIKISNPDNLPSSSAYGVSWSPNGNYLAVAHSNTPYISIYSKSNDSLTKLPNPVDLPSYHARTCAWSPNGNYLVVGYISLSPRMIIYKIDGEVFTKLPYPSDVPGGSVYASGWSSDNVYLAIGFSSSPYLYIYKRTGDSFTKILDPDIPPTGGVYSVAFSENDNYLAVGHANSPYISIYSHSGDTFTKMPDPSPLPAGIVRGISWTSDGYLAAATGNSPYLRIYKNENETFINDYTKVDMGPTGSAYGISWSPNSSHLAVAHYLTPYVSFYSLSPVAFTKLNPPPAPPVPTDSLQWSPNGSFLACGGVRTGTLIKVYEVINGTNFQSLSISGRCFGAYGCEVEELAWSPNAEWLAAGQSFDPVLTLYHRENETYFNISTNITAYPQGWYIGGIEWSSNSSYLAITSQGTPYLQVYQNINSTFLKLGNPSQLPLGVGYRGVSWNPDGTELVMGEGGGKYIAWYGLENNSLIRRSSCDVGLTSYSQDLDWRSDGKYIAAINPSTPYIYLYSDKRKHGSPDIPPTALSRALEWSPNGSFLAVCFDSTPWVQIYSVC